MKYLILIVALVVSAPGTAMAENYGTVHQLFTYCFGEEYKADKAVAGYCVGAMAGMISAAQLTDNNVDYCIPDGFSGRDGKEMFRLYMHSRSDEIAEVGMYRPYQAFRAALVKYHPCGGVQ